MATADSSEGLISVAGRQLFGAETEVEAEAHTTTSVGGVPIANLDYEGFLQRIAHWISTGWSRYICVVPAASVVEAALDPSHREALRGAGLNAADGMPVVWTQRLLGRRGASRVYGPELTLRTLATAAERGWRVAFYGGHPQRLAAMTQRLHARFPRLRIADAVSPPFRKLSASEDEAMVRRLADARPDILFVGLGCPKQERWMADHIGRLPCVMLGVGAAFDFHAGAVHQAPPLLQRFGLEWAFRLACEPRRLWKRYVKTNPIFVAIMIHHVARHWLAKMSWRGRATQDMTYRPSTSEHDTTSVTKRKAA